MSDSAVVIQIAREEKQESPHALFIPQPRSVEETGLDFGLLLDLCVKTIYYGGRPAARQIAAQMALSFNAVEELLRFLKREQYCEVAGSAGLSEQNYNYTLTSKGVDKAEEALERSRYVGPAPVPFDRYIDVLERQSVKKLTIESERAMRALDELVLDQRTLQAVGPAVNSGKAVLLYGPSGNGKSTMAKAIGNMMQGEILVPHAVEVNGQIIKIYDPHTHEVVEVPPPVERRQHDAADDALPTGFERRRDRRWVMVRRPLVVAGGELTLRDLEMRHDPVSKFYVAPLQVKANGGVLVIDDFGRQIVQPRELLNRWIVPMDKGWDNLTLHTGESIEVPFDVLLVFSTNIPPAQLGDEAFFRRIRHKVEVPNPTEENFLEILRRACAASGLPYSEEGAAHLVQRHYQATGRPFRGCHPRDIVELIQDIARFRGIEPRLDPELIDVACASYFVDM